MQKRKQLKGGKQKAAKEVITNTNITVTVGKLHGRRFRVWVDEQTLFLGGQRGKCCGFGTPITPVRRIYKDMNAPV